MGKTPIQWSEWSVNPIVAYRKGDLGDIDGPPRRAYGHYCVKVSPGCKNCYSSRMQPRFGLPQFQEQRKDEPALELLSKRLLQVLRRKKPTKWFWCDMTDMFGDWVPNEWIAACFGVMAATPWHTHQVLTKRARRMREWFAWVGGLHGPLGTASTVPAMGVMGAAAKLPELVGPMTAAYQKAPLAWPLSNVHLGVSCEDQRRADDRIPDLLHCPAAVHWVSAEPLLGPVDLQPFRFRGPLGRCRRCDCKQFDYEAGEHPGVCNCNHDDGEHRPQVSWVVVGGESGRGARQFDLAWARAIVEHGRFTSTPVFMKQLGAYPVDRLEMPIIFSVPFEQFDASPVGGAGAMVGGGAITHRRIKLRDSHGGDPTEWPADLRVREFPA